MNELDLFASALELQSPEDRARYLDQVCGDNHDLRRRIDELLRAHGHAGSFMDDPAAQRIGPATIQEPIVEGPGTMIGPYKLLEQIGEGGFGVVFLAEQQEPVRRKVALKVLKPGMDTKQVIARFEAERQALAIMDHPNIARVFDGGATPSGRPYFVMELVKGVPITEYCDQQHLTPRQRLELFVHVCQAVQHAHHKGIIHRDLKPSNVLVSRHDSTPVVKVIDFGVAKALGQELTDKTLFTGIAQMIGTPLYMSPEQAGMSDLDIDTRSDVYSLGVLLYELLTGTTPFTKDRFRKAGCDEIRRILREEEPPRPSTRLSESTESLPSISAQRQTEPGKLTRLVRGELDWIVMKALEKDRNRRYETANGFAMDVQRYLADEPVQACPPSAGYRLRKFVRRNKVILTTIGLVLCASLIGTLVSSWQAVVATNARTEASEARDRESQQRQLAEGNMALAYDALDRIYLRVVEDELPRHPDRLDGYRKVLTDALEFYSAFVAKNEGSAEARSRLSVALVRAGNIQLLLMNHPKAVEVFERSRAVIVELLKENPEAPSYRADLVAVHAQIGMAHYQMGKWRDAEKSYEAAAQAAQGLPSSPDWDQRIVAVHLRRGQLNRKFGRLDLSEQCNRQAIEVCRRVQGAAPTPRWRQIRAECEDNLGVTLVDLGRYQEGDDHLKEAIATLQTLEREFPNSAAYTESLCNACSNRSYSLISLGRKSESSQHALEAVRSAERLVRAFPVNLTYQSLLLKSQVNRTGGIESAIVREPAALDRIVALATEMADQFSNMPDRLLELASICNNVGVEEELTGRWPQAEKTYRKGQQTADRLIKAHPQVPEYREIHIRLLGNLGDVLGLQGTNGAAEAAYRQACKESAALVEAFPHMPGHRINDAFAHSQLAKHLRRVGRAKEAVEAQRELIARLDKLVKEKPTLEKAKHYLAKAHVDLGSFLFDLKIYPDALSQFRLGEQFALELVQATGGKNSDYRGVVAHVSLNRGDLLRTTGQHADSEKAYREALRLQEKIVADFPDDPERQADLLRIIEHFAMLMDKTNRLAVLLPEVRRGIEVGEKLVKGSPKMPEYKDRLIRLNIARGGIHVVAKEYSEALTLTVRTLDLAEQLVAEFPQNRKHVSVRNLLLNNIIALGGMTGDPIQERRGLERQLALRPEDPMAINAMAWFLATTSNPSLRDPKRACALAEKAVLKYPNDGHFQGTLGTACFRAGDMEHAIKSLEQAVQLHKDDPTSTGYNQLFLAMAYFRSGDKAKATQAFTRGETAIRNLPAMHADQHARPLAALLAEAKELLGKTPK